MRQVDAAQRKKTPVYSGVLTYFPDALAEVSRVSQAGNDQHNPGKPLHWDRSKSGDEYDACTRHLLDRAAGEIFDTDGQRHMAKVAWRALAALQKEVEAYDAGSDAAAKAPWDDDLGNVTTTLATLPESRYERIQRQAREKDSVVTLMQKLRKVDDGSPEAFAALEEYEREKGQL